LIYKVEEFQNESRDSVKFNTMYARQIVFGRYCCIRYFL